MGSAMVSPGSDCQSDGNQTPSKTGPLAEEAAGPDDIVAGLGNAFTGQTQPTLTEATVDGAASGKDTKRT